MRFILFKFQVWAVSAARTHLSSCMKNTLLRFTVGLLPQFLNFFEYLSVLYILFSGGFVCAEEYKVNVTRGRLEAFPIAVPTFQGGASGLEVSTIISNDLGNSGIFRLIDPRAFVQTADSLAIAPRYSDWRLINANSLVAGKVKVAGGNVVVSYQLFDVFAEKEIDRFEKTVSPAQLRQAAHEIADRIHLRLIGVPGYFNTRILYVAESGPATARQKRLAVMDQDGYGVRYLTNPALGMAMTPRICPTRNEAAFMAYRNRRAQVCFIDLDTGQERTLGNFRNMTFSPRYSPDGKNLVLSYSEHGNSDVYIMDLTTRKVTRLTQNTSINTSPCFSPDGKKIVFNSDRGGSQQLYIMNADGTAQTRISHGEGIYATPVWAPTGDLIAFTKRQGGQFYIGLMHLDGSQERVLTKGDYLVEGPEWAPNGRLLTFYRQGRRDAQGRASSYLYSIHVSGEHEQLIRTASDASDPAWSPLRH